MFNLFKNKNQQPIIEDEKTSPEISIMIESDSDTPLFSDEEEQIRSGAQTLLDNKFADSMEDAIITFATMFRGLNFRETKQLEDGKTIIIFRDNANQKKLTLY